MERDRGSVTMWVVGVMALFMVLAMISMKSASAAVDDGRAQAAADMVALAGVSADRPAATEVAERNGATLLAFEVTAEVVSVTVRRSGVVATAHASEGEIPAGP
jgi:hypothetical protein